LDRREKNANKGRNAAKVLTFIEETLDSGRDPHERHGSRAPATGVGAVILVLSAHTHRGWFPTATPAYLPTAAEPRHQRGCAEAAAVIVIADQIHFAGSTATASISINAPSRASF
jgi:hypothetical protein